MMNLIDRAAAIDAIVQVAGYEDKECIKRVCKSSIRSMQWIGGVEESLEAIEKQPTIEAVPLDKLCEWLANVAKLPAPCYYLSDYCKFEDFGHCELDEPDLAKCWKRVLKTWMEG